MENLLNLKILEELSKETDSRIIESYFQNLLDNISLYLKLYPIYNEVKIRLVGPNSKISFKEQDIFNLGVKRTIQNNIYYLEIYENYKSFLPIIFLREIFNNFLPEAAINNTIIQICISQLILNLIPSFTHINEWWSQLREYFINYDIISSQFDKIGKFFALKIKSSEQDTIQFFFEYIRKNYLIIDDKISDLYEQIFNEFSFKTPKSINNNDVVETLAVLIKIFYNAKIFRSFTEYQEYFKDLKEQNQTPLSLNKFMKNVDWINKFSYISPSYQINWKAINIEYLVISLTFNPILNHSKVNTILKDFPFLIQSKYSKNSFAFEIRGFVLLPTGYLSDFLEIIEKLYQNGYVIKRTINFFQKFRNFLNLNYFRTYPKKDFKILNPNNVKYDKKYEIEFEIDYKPSYVDSKLSYNRLDLIDWLIIGRIRYFSLTGITFQKRSETLKALKSDLINEIMSQRVLIKELKDNLNIIYSFQINQAEIIDFIERIKAFGFFYIKNFLMDLLKNISLLEHLLLTNPLLTDIFKVQDYIQKRGVTQSIDDVLIFKQKTVLQFIFTKILPLYFKSKERYKKEVQKYNLFYKIFSSFSDLKIINLKSIKEIISDRKLADEIFRLKDEKLRNNYEKYKMNSITNQEIDERLLNYLTNDPPLIKPLLINTILTTTFTKYYPIIVLKSTEEARESLKRLKSIFPRILTIFVKERFTDNDYIIIELYIPNLKEKQLLVSILFNIFGKNIIYYKRFHWSGLGGPFSIKNFYDFANKRFFYTKDLFQQYYMNIQKILGKQLDSVKESENKIQNKFWSKEKDISILIKQVQDRVRSENIDLNTSNLHHVLEFNTKLEENLLNLSDFKESQEKVFFKNYIKSIDFIPSFKHFGMSQYFLYFYPTDINQIDFKLLISNSFQSVKYPAQIDNSNSFLFQYIFPYRNPGISPYLNWLTKSKKIVREYCLFFVKKVYQILHFNYNLSSDGWDLDSNRFKIYFQNILFNPDYKVQIPCGRWNSAIREFNIGDLNVSDYLGPDSPEFKALSQIYNKQSLDIKSYLTRRYFTLINHITDLLKKRLIFPYVSVKNIGGEIEKITIILPSVKQELNETIIKIFSFFNVGFIYTIEGVYFIHGFDEVIKFENGLMIKLHLPDCQLDEFEKLFAQIFEYLEIDHYLVLNDLIDGENLVKSTFHELESLETFNPLINLIWNDKDKKWQNHKLFKEDFKPVYPNLSYGKEKYGL